MKKVREDLIYSDLKQSKEQNSCITHNCITSEIYILIEKRWSLILKNTFKHIKFQHKLYHLHNDLI